MQQMAGSGGTSLLETAPYIIALVFTFFLVVTLGFEKVREACSILLRWRRVLGHS